jgi:hypothetical protein
MTALPACAAPEFLTELARSAERRVGSPNVAPLRRSLPLIRQAAYGKALTALRAVDRASRDPLFFTARGFVRRLRGPLFGLLVSRNPEAIAPTGTEEDVETLGLAIAGEDLVSFRAAMETASFDAGERALARARRAAPYSRILAFLEAACLLRRAASAMPGVPSDDAGRAIAALDEIVSTLRVGEQAVDRAHPHVAQSNALRAAIRSLLAEATERRDDEKRLLRLAEKLRRLETDMPRRRAKAAEAERVALPTKPVRPTLVPLLDLSLDAVSSVYPSPSAADGAAVRVYRELTNIVTGAASKEAALHGDAARRRLATIVDTAKGMLVDLTERVPDVATLARQLAELEDAFARAKARSDNLYSTSATAFVDRTPPRGEGGSVRS